MRLAGTEYFKMLGEVDKFNKQRGQPAPSDALLGNDGGDPSPGTSGANGGQVASNHHHAHPSAHKPGIERQGQGDSSGTMSGPSLHIRRGGVIDEVA